MLAAAAATLSTNEAGNVTVEQLAAQNSGETLADGARPRYARQGS
jgi:hypothetical protein